MSLSMCDVSAERILNGKSAFITGGGSGINLTIAQCFARHGAGGHPGAKAGEARCGCQADRVCRWRCDRLRRRCSAIRCSCERVKAGARTARSHRHPGLRSCGQFPGACSRHLSQWLQGCRGHRSARHVQHLSSGVRVPDRPGASVINISAAECIGPDTGTSARLCGQSRRRHVDPCSRGRMGPDGVRINSIAPGPVDDTEGMRRLAPTTEVRNRINHTIPLRRFATKEEIAALALFLCSDAAQYITGAVIPCDGGQSLSGHSLQ